jgi:hypothetical protein
MKHANRFADSFATNDLPDDFVELSECMASHTDRQLGYFGNGRFVAFRYEPRAEDVIWRDERTFGIATGAWQAFFDEILPLADLYGVNVGTNTRPADHVVLFDRTRKTGYFAPRQSAEAFLSHRQEMLPAV